MICARTRTHKDYVTKSAIGPNAYASLIVSTAPAIVYDTLKGKYVQASSVTQLSNPVKQHIMRQDTKRVMKSYVSNTDW
jgi:hypothetical protein